MDYLIDSADNVTPLSQYDTIVALGDTSINGNMYMGFSRVGASIPNNDGPMIYHWRDSSGYIVDEVGRIVYSTLTTKDTLEQQNTGDHDITIVLVDKTNEPITVPAGTYNTYEKQYRWKKSDGSPVNECMDEEFTVFSNYTVNDGMIVECRSYMSDMKFCQRREFRLESFYSN